MKKVCNSSTLTDNRPSGNDWQLFRNALCARFRLGELDRQAKPAAFDKEIAAYAQYRVDAAGISLNVKQQRRYWLMGRSMDWPVAVQFCFAFHFDLEQAAAFFQDMRLPGLRAKNLEQFIDMCALQAGLSYGKAQQLIGDGLKQLSDPQLQQKDIDFTYLIRDNLLQLIPRPAANDQEAIAYADLIRRIVREMLPVFGQARYTAWVHFCQALGIEAGVVFAKQYRQGWRVALKTSPEAVAAEASQLSDFPLIARLLQQRQSLTLSGDQTRFINHSLTAAVQKYAAYYRQFLGRYLPARPTELIELAASAHKIFHEFPDMETLWQMLHLKRPVNRETVLFIALEAYFCMIYEDLEAAWQPVAVFIDYLDRELIQDDFARLDSRNRFDQLLIAAYPDETEYAGLISQCRKYGDGDPGPSLTGFCKMKFLRACSSHQSVIAAGSD